MKYFRAASDGARFVHRRAAAGTPRPRQIVVDPDLAFFDGRSVADVLRSRATFAVLGTNHGNYLQGWGCSFTHPGIAGDHAPEELHSLSVRFQGNAAFMHALLVVWEGWVIRDPRELRPRIFSTGIPGMGEGPAAAHLLYHLVLSRSRRGRITYCCRSRSPTRRHQGDGVRLAWPEPPQPARASRTSCHDPRFFQPRSRARRIPHPWLGSKQNVSRGCWKSVLSHTSNDALPSRAMPFRNRGPARPSGPVVTCSECVYAVIIGGCRRWRNRSPNRAATK